MVLQNNRQLTAALMEASNTDLSGKVVLITGGTSGQGLLFAELFAGLKATTVISGKNTIHGLQALERLERIDGGGCAFIPGSTDSFAGCQSVINEVATLFDRLDLVVNYCEVAAKGISFPAATLNAAGYASSHIVKCAEPLLYKSGGGAVVSVFTGKEATNSLSYTDNRRSKTAVLPLSMRWVKGLAPYDLHIHSVCPTLEAAPIPGLQTVAVKQLQQYFARLKSRTHFSLRGSSSDIISTVGFITLAAAVFSTGGGVWPNASGWTAC